VAAAAGGRGASVVGLLQGAEGARRRDCWTADDNHCWQQRTNGETIFIKSEDQIRETIWTLNREACLSD
jgi:hypothetical protein